MQAKSKQTLSKADEWMQANHHYPGLLYWQVASLQDMEKSLMFTWILKYEIFLTYVYVLVSLWLYNFLNGGS